MKGRLLFFSFFAICFLSNAQELNIIYGKVSDHQGKGLSKIRLLLSKQGKENKEQPKETFTDASGAYRYEQLEKGSYLLNIEHIGYESVGTTLHLSPGSNATADFKLSRVKENIIEEVIKKAQSPLASIVGMNGRKLTTFTRLPVEISYLPQSITVVDQHLISQQGAIDLNQSLQNVPGIYSFSTFNNAARMSGSRGFGGITYMLNNIPFVTGERSLPTLLPDMEGIEQIEVIRGASAIQYGNVGAGGIINLRTKLPKFSQGGYVGLRGGSWNLFRPSLDLYGPLNRKKTLAYRIVGIYEQSDGFRKYIKGRKIYVNPSLEWKPSDDTSLVFEYLYANDARTPDKGTIFYQKDKDDPGKIYPLPFDRFTGFKSDRQKLINQMFSLNLSHKFNDRFALKAIIAHMDETRDLYGLKNHQNQLRPGNMERPSDRFTETINRDLVKETDLYKRNWIQIDLLGTELYTGTVRHDLQLGADFSSRIHKSYRYNSKRVDQINVISDKAIDNEPFLPELSKKDLTKNNYARFGVGIHDLMTLDKRWRVTMGLRYTTESNNQVSTAYTDRKGIPLASDQVKKNPQTTSAGFSPSAGLIYSPAQNLNLYASYTNTFDPTTYRDQNGASLGNNVINQIETGIKSNWLKDALLFNLSLYKIFNRNQIINVVEQNKEGTFQISNYHTRGGSTMSQGIELEIRAQPVKNLNIMGSFTYQSARYKKSDFYKDDSETFNVPGHIANLWVHYTLGSGIFKNLSLGIGAYYIGDRWANEALKVSHPYLGSTDEKRIKLPGYTSINTSLSYTYKNIQLSFYANNLANELGYTAYRSYYINPIDPRNYSLALQYHF